MKKNENASIERRSVFRMLGIGAFATMLVNAIPIRANKRNAAKEQTKHSTIKINIHPAAVQREKSGGMK